MAEVILTKAMCVHLALLFNERRLKNTENVLPDSLPTRLLFVRAALGDTDPLMFNLSVDQLRALDMLLTDGDPREGKLPDGAPVMELVEVIWRALTGAGDGREDEDGNAHQHAGADSGQASC